MWLSPSPPAGHPKSTVHALGAVYIPGVLPVEQGNFSNRLLPRKWKWGVARKYAYANTGAWPWQYANSPQIHMLP